MCIWRPCRLHLEPLSGDNAIWCQAWLACLYMVPSLILPWNCCGQPTVFGEATEMREWEVCVDRWKQEGQRKRETCEIGSKHEQNEQGKKKRKGKAKYQDDGKNAWNEVGQWSCDGFRGNSRAQSLRRCARRVCSIPKLQLGTH